MINAGRVLIIPQGEWTNLESYEMLDLVTRGDIAYIARQASVGVDPATDTQLTYWQPFGTAAKIATTTTPGLVMPDGTTVTIDATGLISANIGISDINNVTITSISNGQILQYNSSTQKWENKSLGSAASRNATSSITSGSTDLIESGAVNSLKQTLESGINTVSNNLNNVSAQVSDNEDAYSSSKPYKVGQLCIHNNKVYKCITACSAAAWSVNSSCFESDTLANIVNDLNEYEIVTDSQSVGSFTTNFKLHKKGNVVTIALTVTCSVDMGNNWYDIATLPFKPKNTATMFGTTLSNHLSGDLTVSTTGVCRMYIYGSTGANDYAKFSGTYITND